MALGFLNLGYISRVLPYDDQKTPLALIGQKMLPILVSGGTPIKESLDIIKKLDQRNELSNDSDLGPAEAFIKAVNNPVHSLTMPHWIYTQEFTPSSREYFIKQKEAKRGPFKELVAKSDLYTDELKPLLNDLSNKLKPFFHSERITVQDIIIAAHLWGLYVVPEFQFPEKIHQYLQNVKRLTHFQYHQDYWS
jgi:glutaredoxin 2